MDNFAQPPILNAALSFWQLRKHTATLFSAEKTQTGISLYVLFAVSVAMGSLLMTLAPEPDFLAHVGGGGGGYRTGPLLLWAALAALACPLCGMLVDFVGYKRVLSFALILSLIVTLFMGGIVGLSEAAEASPALWIFGALSSVCYAGVFTAAHVSIATFTRHPMAAKFSLALAAGVFHLGLAVATALHSVAVKGALAVAVETGAPGLGHPETVLGVLLGATALSSALFAVPFIKKNRHLAKHPHSRLVHLRSVRRPAWYRLLAFSLLTSGAWAAQFVALYTLPKFATRTFLLDASAVGLYKPLFIAAAGALAAVHQIAWTGVNPFVVIYGFGILGSAALAVLMGPASVAGLASAAGLLALAHGAWWPRFLAYACEASVYGFHAGAFLGVALSAVWQGALIAYGATPALLDAFCADADACAPEALWGVLLAICAGPPILNAALYRFLRDSTVFSHWRKYLRLPVRSDEELGDIGLSDSSQSGEQPITLETSDQDADGNPF